MHARDLSYPKSMFNGAILFIISTAILFQYILVYLFFFVKFLTLINVTVFKFLLSSLHSFTP